VVFIENIVVRNSCSGVADPKVWEERNIFDFKWATVFGLGHRLSKHKTTRYARNL